MANNTTVDHEDGTQSVYTCGDKKGFEYYKIGDDIKNDFSFLKGTSTGETAIAGRLDLMLSSLKIATDNMNAFKISAGSDGGVNNLNELYEEISQDVKALKNNLDVLHNAFMTDIDNVNAELDTNFGWWIGHDVKESKRKSK